MSRKTRTDHEHSNAALRLPCGARPARHGAYATGTAVGPLPLRSAQAGDIHSGTVAEAHPGSYTLAPATPALTTATPETFSFTVTGPDGAPVTAFDVEHEKRMHLIVVRRDTTGFQHVHPDMAPDGTWSVPLTVAAPGTYRVLADFTPTGGAPTTLGADVPAPGAFEPVTHAPGRTAQIDGYTVELAGDLVAGQASPVTLTVGRDGVPVTDLQPYLGADGHLVALREGDLAYLHVHPAGPGAGGPGIGFVAEVPSAGSYRLFLDFRHGDVVRTAAFTVPTVASPAPAAGRHGH